MEKILQGHQQILILQYSDTESARSFNSLATGPRQEDSNSFMMVFETSYKSNFEVK